MQTLARINKMPVVHMLDYAAGNIRSLINAIEKLGWQVEWIKEPKDIEKAEVCCGRLADHCIS